MSTPDDVDSVAPPYRRRSMGRRLTITAALMAGSAAAISWLALPPTVSLVLQHRLLAEATAWQEPAHTAVSLLSEAGVIGLGVLLLGAAWPALRGRTSARPGVAVGVAGILLAYLISEILKVAVEQPRPCQLSSTTQSLIPCPPADDWAFPSNHATVATGLAVAVVILAPRLWVIALPTAALVALSRVALGVHYPHDVIAGALIGAVTVTMLHVCRAPRLNRLVSARASASRPRTGHHEQG